MKNIDIFRKWVFIVCILGFLAGLAAYSYMGLNMRLIGDDYCEAAVLTKYGFFNGQFKAFFNPMPFHGNRYTKTFIVLFFSLFQPKINGYLPAAMLLIFSMGLFSLQSAFSQFFKTKISLLFKIFISLAIVFFTFLLAPTVNQSLYWRSSMLPSTAPIFGTLFLLSLILKENKGNWLIYGFLFFFSFFTGGLSENGVLFQLSSVSIMLSVFLISNLKTDVNRVTMKKTLAAVMGSISSVIMMWLSPSIAQEQNEMTISVFDSIKLSFSHTLAFYSGFIKSFFVAIIALIMIGFLAYILNFIRSSNDYKINSPNWKRWVIIFIFSQVVVLFLIFSNMIPSAFTRNSYPDPRHLIIATFSSVVGFVLLGCFLAELGINFGFRLGLINNLAVFGSISILLIFITGFYPIRYIPQITENNDKFRYWSSQWDQRDMEIRREIAFGENILHVMKMESIIEGVGEISPNPDYWYNLCAADYYGVSRIYADLPGWDEGWSNFK